MPRSPGLLRPMPVGRKLMRLKTAGQAAAIEPFSRCLLGPLLDRARGGKIIRRHIEETKRRNESHEPNSAAARLFQIAIALEIVDVLADRAKLGRTAQRIGRRRFWGYILNRPW